MPVINIEMHEGRTIAQKKLLVEGITAEFIKIGTPAEKVTIIFRDVPKHDWANAGKLAAESSIRQL
ncbi:MAG: tautomerase family protein [Dehalogenimonas sp.]